MKDRYKIVGAGNWDSRIIPIKNLYTDDGSEEHFGLLASPIKSWEHERDFVNALKVFEYQEAVENEAERFEKVLNFLNEWLPNEVTINPRRESPKKLLDDGWNFRGIMWQENECYIAYFWLTTA